MQNGPEPDRGKPCWVLLCQGGTKDGTGFKVTLAEYEFTGGAWRRTETPPEQGSFYNLLRRADWFGKLPQMGRKRTASTVGNFTKAADLFDQGVPLRQVAQKLGIGNSTVSKLHKLWLS